MSILFLRRGCELHDPHISPHGVGVECSDDETNEQRILRAPAITLADHTAVYDAKCGRPQKGEGVDQMRTPADRGRGRKRGLFCGRLLWTTPYLTESRRRINLSKDVNVKSVKLPFERKRLYFFFISFGSP